MNTLPRDQKPFQLDRSTRDEIALFLAKAALAAGPAVMEEYERGGDARSKEDGSPVMELRREGLAREVIRLVQEGRKADGLDVTDRIALRWSASNEDLAAALIEHASRIAGEVLATEYGPEVATGDAPEHAEPELGLRFWLKRV